VHPQSIVHALVEYIDGSVMAQLASHDMRVPIALALSWPARMQTPVARLDLIAQKALTFEAPDEQRFPALALSRAALRRGGAAPTVLNAANEVAVEGFLAGRLSFPGITEVVAHTLELADKRGHQGVIGDVALALQIDAEARSFAKDAVGRLGGP
jgi:1-deoxy-D-xylulose-5-phosphate reductoisomerase